MNYEGEQKKHEIMWFCTKSYYNNLKDSKEWTVLIYM